jgi:hypothetical protein
VVALLIKLSGFFENLVGTEFNTKAAPLTAVFDDEKFPNRYGMGLGI